MRRSGPCGRNPAKGCEALRCRLGADQRHRGLPPRKIGEPYRALANWISRGVLQNAEGGRAASRQRRGRIARRTGYAESERTTMLSDLHGSSFRRLVSSAFKTLKRSCFLANAQASLVASCRKTMVRPWRTAAMPCPTCPRHSRPDLLDQQAATGRAGRRGWTRTSGQIGPCPDMTAIRDWH